VDDPLGSGKLGYSDKLHLKRLMDLNQSLFQETSSRRSFINLKIATLEGKVDELVLGLTFVFNTGVDPVHVGGDRK
jgi:hypothetical protein